MVKFMSLALFSGLLAGSISNTEGHGYMAKPAPRNVVHKGGPYGPGDIMSLAAGGPTTVAKQGHGLCGDVATRKAFMAPSQYGPTEPQATYVQGQWIDIEITVTAHHWGWFEFRLCDPEDDGVDKSKPITQACLNKHVLKMDVQHAVELYGDKMRNGVSSPADYEGDSSIYTIEHAKCQYLPGSPDGSCCNNGGDCSGPTRWMLPDPAKAGKEYKMRYKLPEGVTCERCVLQWYWQTGNSIDAYPETFWNCADVRITGTGGPIATKIPTASPAPGSTQKPTASPKVQPVTSKPTASPVPAGTRTCISKKGPTYDKFCVDVKCDPTYKDFCKWSTDEDDTTGGGSACVSKVAHITDAWCASVNCDPAYKDFCELKMDAFGNKDLTSTKTEQATGETTTASNSATIVGSVVGVFLAGTVVFAVGLRRRAQRRQAAEETVVVSHYV